MAQGQAVGKQAIELEVLERQWIHRALELQRAALIRSRSKEMAGSEVWQLRGREIEALTALLNRF